MHIMDYMIVKRSLTRPTEILFSDGRGFQPIPQTNEGEPLIVWKMTMTSAFAFARVIRAERNRGEVIEAVPVSQYAALKRNSAALTPENSRNVVNIGTHASREATRKSLGLGDKPRPRGGPAKVITLADL